MSDDLDYHWKASKALTQIPVETLNIREQLALAKLKDGRELTRSQIKKHSTVRLQYIIDDQLFEIEQGIIKVGD
jgi:hypothetical protein